MPFFLQTRTVEFTTHVIPPHSFAPRSFIATLVFLMVNGDHTPVTINGCNLPQL
jgi:hypothetical protein